MILLAICVSEKKDLRRGVEETYLKTHVLHWIENLEQRGGWVTMVILLILCNLVSALIPVIKSANSRKDVGGSHEYNQIWATQTLLSRNGKR